MSEARLRSTAYHEAGHAVVAYFLASQLISYVREPFRYVTIKPKPGESLGHVRLRIPKWARPHEEPSTPLAWLKFQQYWEQSCIAAFAGRVAEQKHLGKRVRYGYDSDYASMVDVGLFIGGESRHVHVHWFRWLHMGASEWVNARWLEIEAVAEALMERQTLTYDEVRTVIDELFQKILHDPEVAERHRKIREQLIREATAESEKLMAEIIREESSANRRPAD
jgi:hypothetical protein